MGGREGREVGREGGREGGRDEGREEGRDGGREGGMEGTRAKPGNQLVYNNESFGKWCTDFYLQIFTNVVLAQT